MIIRSFLLFKSLDKSDDGLAFVEPFSGLKFEEFPTEEIEFRIALAFECLDLEEHQVEMKLYNPKGKLMGTWPTHKFRDTDVLGTPGIVFRQNSRFETPGIYYYHISVDNQIMGKYSLVVNNRER